MFTQVTFVNEKVQMYRKKWKHKTLKKYNSQRNSNGQSQYDGYNQL